MAGGSAEVAELLTHCPKCHGLLFLDSDEFGFEYLRCWNCARPWPVDPAPVVTNIDEEYYLMQKEGRHRK